MKFLKNNRGSLMIWTVLLGLVLSSVYFFVATRSLRVYGELIETQKYQANKKYLESYADYLMSLPLVTLSGMSSMDLDEIKGTLGRKQGILEGFLEMNATKAIQTNPGNTVMIFWDRCDWQEEADLVINGSELHESQNNCAEDETYGASTGFTSSAAEFTLQALGNMHYQILGDNIESDEWYLNLTMLSETGKTLKIEKTFTPE